MAFTIDIGYTTDNTYEVYKRFTPVRTGVSISPLSVINQLNPTFVIDYDSSIISNNCNYVIANFLGRKYVCTLSVDTAQRIILSCSVDYLTSFNLRDCPITVIRNGGIGAPTEIPDNKFPVLPNRKQIDSITVFNEQLGDFAKDVRALNYVITTIGGGT